VKYKLKRTSIDTLYKNIYKSDKNTLLGASVGHTASEVAAESETLFSQFAELS